MPYLSEVFLVLGGLCVLAGLVGCVVPFLIGPPLGYAGLLLLHFSKYGEFSTQFLVIMGVLALVASVLDNILPVLGVQKTGGSKRAVTGSVIGLIAGIFILPPLGLIIFPFIGALVAELTTGRKFSEALKTSLGSLAGLMLGIVLKLAVSGIMIYYFAQQVLLYFRQ